MPYKSKAQHRLFRAKEARDEIEAGTSSRWARETKDLKQLPEYVRKKRRKKKRRSKLILKPIEHQRR